MCERKIALVAKLFFNNKLNHSKLQNILDKLTIAEANFFDGCLHSLIKDASE